MLAALAKVGTAMLGGLVSCMYLKVGLLVLGESVHVGMEESG